MTLRGRDRARRGDRVWRVAVFAALTWMLLAPGVARADELAFAVVRHALPDTMCAGERLTVELELRNDGETSWDAEAGDRVAYHWVDASGTEVVREGKRTALVEAVLPGRTTTLRVRVDAPTTAGRHTLVWAMVRDRVRWFAVPPDASETARPTLEIVEGARPLGFTIAVDAVAVAAGEMATIPVRLTNTGCAAWSSAYGDALAYHWFDAEGREVVHEGRRTPLPMVEPGASVDLDARVDGPPTAGVHTLVFEPVREPLAWFGAPTMGAASVTIEVGAPSLAWTLLASDTPAEAFAATTVRARVRVRNDGTEPWRHDRGDRLSYHLRRIDEEGDVIEGARTPWPSDVEPGEEVEVEATLELPPVSGRYAVVWEPVRERVRWLGPSLRGPGATRDETVIEVGPRQLAWSIERLDLPGRVWASRTTEIHVVVRNEGGDTWSPRTGDRLSFRWLADDGTPAAGDGMRTELPHDVAPGESVELAVRVRARDEVGNAALQLAMVREHVAWFPDAAGPESSVRSVVVVRWGVLLTTGALALLAMAGVASRGTERSSPLVTIAWAPATVAVACLGFGELFVDLAHIEAWTGTRLGSVTAAAWIAAPLVLLPVRWQPWTAGVVIVITFALSLVDLGYLAFFGSIVPMSAITAVHHLGDSHATVFSLWRDEYLLLAWPLLSLVVLVGLRPRPVAVRWTSRAAAFGLFVACSLPAVIALVQVARSPIGERVFSERDNVGRLGLWNAHLFEAGRQLGRWIGIDALTDAQRREVDRFFARRVAERATPGEADHPVANAPLDVVVIQIEAMQDWVVDAEIGGVPVMPFVAGAEGDAVRFTSIFDQTAQGRTSDAEYLVLQSGHPLRTGALSFLRADNEFDTIAHTLAASGYATQSAHPYARGFWNRAAIHPRYGIATSRFREELGAGPMVGWGLGDVAFLERSAALFTEQPSPSFAFFITLSLHHPYSEFPPQLAELDTSEIVDPALANYLQGMRHADRALAGFFAALQASGRASRTIVLVYGDHVTGMPWTDEIGRLAGLDRWDPTVPAREHRVGALLWLPDRSRVGRDDRIGGQIDLAPTLLDALGQSAPASFVGRSLWRDGPRLVALPDGTAIADDRIWIARGRDFISGGGCFDRDGRSRDRKDCDAIAAAAADELWSSRAVLDHDLYRALGR